ncbi:MAG: transcriptional regulator, MarR family [Ramlibacter sp.]|jgi:DNA-binding MarR family transcriptional regulator|nr:transcriptional regulator, MarR family [Ramlibacter sp.]
MPAKSAKPRAPAKHRASPTPRAARRAPPRAARPLPPPVFYRPEDYDPEQSVAFLMRRILASASMEVERELEPSGLTNAQWVPLLKLSMGSASTVAELARGCQLDTGGMTRLLDRLETKGLVRRVRSSEDRRVVNLELTEEGRAAAKTIPAVLCGVQNAHMRGFTVQEWQTLKTLLRRILDNALEIQAAKDPKTRDEKQ